MAPSPLGQLRIVWHSLRRAPLLDLASQIAHLDARIRQLEYEGAPRAKLDAAERERTDLLEQPHGSQVEHLLAESARLVAEMDRERGQANKHKLTLPKRTDAEIAERDRAFAEANSLANAYEAADDLVAEGERALQQHFSTRATESLAHEEQVLGLGSGEHQVRALGRTTRQHLSVLSLRQRALYFGVSAV